MSNVVEIRRTSRITVKISELKEEEVVIDVHENGEFIQAEFNGEILKVTSEKGKEKGVPGGTIKVTQNSPWCICYYDPYRGWVCIGTTC